MIGIYGLPSHPCSPILMPSLVGLLVSTIFSTRQDWRFSYWKKIDYRLMNVFNETFVYRDTNYRRGDTFGSRIHFMTRQNVDMAFSLLRNLMVGLKNTLIFAMQMCAKNPRYQFISNLYSYWMVSFLMASCHSARCLRQAITLRRI